MKITDSIISIPPYISTTWDNVAALSMEANDLIIILKNGESVLVPHLTPEAIEQIFSRHAAFLEAHTQGIKKFNMMPLHFNITSIEGLGEAMQHNPAFSGLPPIPEDSIQRIASLAKAIPADDILAMPLPEENCNCMYCQVLRILRKAVTPVKEEEGEKVKDEELRFDSWKVELVSDKVYRVSNKLDPQEEYTVRLDDPVSCSCGRANCEHIVAVLRS